ncbi:MAG: hypothetical protein CVU40_04735 [Chloroflexi bacterium HGW-Chloroflexi-2]|jgi:uncharacterized protein (DUF427 family)|nr:MAG: hypothetical protein CVU40_04735 [Chloroflexi bacterium HGW-Chloroflexi-2]
MAKAIWNGKVIAESEIVKKVEGNLYFPPESINKEYFQENDSHTVCPWKGKASYFDIVVDGKTNRSAAWYYPQPSSAAQEIKDHVAFWKGVIVDN